MSQKCPQAAHSSYEILRRLPDDTKMLETCCAHVRNEFAKRNLIDSEAVIEWQSYRSSVQRRIPAANEKILTDTAKALHIGVPHLITLLVCMYDLQPCWEIQKKREKPNPHPNGVTPKAWKK